MDGCGREVDWKIYMLRPVFIVNDKVLRVALVITWGIGSTTLRRLCTWYDIQMIPLIFPALIVFFITFR